VCGVHPPDVLADLVAPQSELPDVQDPASACSHPGDAAAVGDANDAPPTPHRTAYYGDWCDWHDTRVWGIHFIPVCLKPIDTIAVRIPLFFRDTPNDDAYALSGGWFVY
jgi:hypothetical protein